MLLLQQSEATAAQRRIFFILEDSTGARVLGFVPTAASAELQYSKNGAAFVSFSGGTWAELSDGLYYYEAPAADVDTLGALIWKAEKASIRTAFVIAQVVPWDPYDVSRLGMTDVLVDAGIKAAKFQAGAIDAAAIANGAIDAATFAAGAIDAAAIADGAIDAGAFAADAITAAKLAADVTTELQAGLATSAALATVQADTDDIQTRLPAALVSGRMDSSVGAIAANAITAASMAADAGAEIAAAVWAYVTEGTQTALVIFRLMTSKLLGKATGQEGGTHTYRDFDDTKNRIVETYAAGARTPTTRDGT